MFFLSTTLRGRFRLRTRFFSPTPAFLSFRLLTRFFLRLQLGFLLYQAARRRLVVERIRPALEAGRVVICDRWHYATSAYQAAGGGADPAAVRLTSKIATEGLEPRRAILLDVPPAVAEGRMDRPLDRMERKGPEFRRRVAAEFRRLFASDPDRYVIVDATRSPDEVERAVFEAVRDLL